MSEQNTIGSRTVSRRSFLSSTASAAALMAGTRLVRGQSEAKPAALGANARLNLAFIGCGGIANHHLDRLLSLREQDNFGFVGVCDIWETRAKQFQDKIKAAGAGDVKLTTDYRDILGMKDVDYVLIATPEHSHAMLTLAALDAGKHVYCEKPMTHDIEEALAVQAKVKQTGLKLQVGVQGTADDSYSSAYEAIREGLLGPVVQAQIEYVRRYDISAGPWRLGIDPKMAKPDDLNWDNWLTPAAKRPWDPCRYHEWRNYRDYSGGIGTDLFVHRITRLIKACGLGAPTRVVGMGGITIWPDGRELPDNFEMMCEYPAIEGVTPGMTVQVLGTMANDYSNPHCIRGYKGTLIFTPGQGWRIEEQGTGKVVKTHKKSGAEDVGLHHLNHHAAIRDNAPLNCPAEVGLAGVIPVVMANQSWAERRMLSWDDKAKKVKA